eukprot:scaffold105198_cov21-Prasinocladus_malaysianus.AAC.1
MSHNMSASTLHQRLNTDGSPAQVMVDPIEAADLLARQGKFKEAAERLQGSFVFGAQSQTKDRLHGYYLQVTLSPSVKWNV